MTEKDALCAHVPDELGMSEVHAANPLQAAIASGATFTGAAAVPLLAAAVVQVGMIIRGVVSVTLVALAGLGAIGAMAGAAPPLRALGRVLFWGAAAMEITAAVGRVFGVSV